MLSLLKIILFSLISQSSNYSGEEIKDFAKGTSLSVIRLMHVELCMTIPLRNSETIKMMWKAGGRALAYYAGPENKNSVRARICVCVCWGGAVVTAMVSGIRAP